MRTLHGCTGLEHLGELLESEVSSELSPGHRQCDDDDGDGDDGDDDDGDGDYEEGRVMIRWRRGRLLPV